MHKLPPALAIATAPFLGAAGVEDTLGFIAPSTADARYVPAESGTGVGGKNIELLVKDDGRFANRDSVAPRIGDPVRRGLPSSPVL